MRKPGGVNAQRSLTRLTTAINESRVRTPFSKALGGGHQVQIGQVQNL